MDLEEYVLTSRLSRKILNWMVGKKMIGDPLSGDDLKGLQLLEKTWGRQEILRSQLSRYPRKRRLRLLESADFATKWERYAFSRFCNLPPGEKLAMKRLCSEIEITFGFQLQYPHIRRLYKVREKAYNRRKRLVKNNV